MTEKQYNIMEYLKNNPGYHTSKDIGVAFGQKLNRASTYPKSVLEMLHKLGKIDCVESPCQPIRWQWKIKEVDHA